MTREIALHCMKSYSELHSDLCELCSIYGETGSDHCFEDALQYVIGMLEQEPTTKNDFALLALLEQTYDDFYSCEGGEGWLKIDGKEYATDAGYAIEGVDIFMEVFKRRLAELPSVTPQEPQTFKWCTDCKEYDQEKHCCHRWSKVIRDTVEEMKQEQEPKTGHWIDIDGGVECDKCGKWYPHAPIAKNEIKFCSECGAKMVEPQESEDKE